MVGGDFAEWVCGPHVLARAFDTRHAELRHEEINYNHQISEFGADRGNVRLKHVDESVEARRLAATGE